MSKNFPKLASVLLGAALTFGLGVDVQAAPVNYSRAAVETPTAAGPIVKAVTRVGVAHRATRRTVRRHHRRYYRRHFY